MMTPILLQTNRDRVKLQEGGYLYVFDKLSSNGEKKFWRCERKKDCNARIHTDAVTNVVVKRASTHNHPSHLELTSSGSVICGSKRRAAYEPISCIEQFNRIKKQYQQKQPSTSYSDDDHVSSITPRSSNETLRMMLEMKHRIEKNKRILSASCPLIKSNHSTSPPSLSVQGRLHDGVHLDDENSAEDSTEDVPNDKNGSVDSSSCTPKKTNDGESSSYIFRSTLDCIKQEVNDDTDNNNNVDNDTSNNNKCSNSTNQSKQLTSSDNTRNDVNNETPASTSPTQNPLLSALTEVRSRISLHSQCNVSPPTTSVSPPQSQVNVMPIGVDKYLSGGFIKWCKRIEWIVDESELVTKMVQNSANCSLGSILLTGAPCTGKSCLSAVIAKSISKKGIRLLSGDDIIGLNEMAKMQAMRRQLEDTCSKSVNVIVLDDLDRFLEYCAVGPKYSNVVLQSLFILLKKIPPPNHRVLIVATASSECAELFGLKDYFTLTFDVPELTEVDHLMTVIEESRLFTDEDNNVLRESLSNSSKGYKIGIKKLLQLLELSKNYDDISARVNFLCARLQKS